MTNPLTKLWHTTEAAPQPGPARTNQAPMQFKVGETVRAARAIPPVVPKGEIGWITAVYEHTGDYVIDFGHEPPNELIRIEESAIMAFDEQTPPTPAAPPAPEPIRSGPPPAPPPPDLRNDHPAVAHAKAQLLTEFTGNPDQISGYRAAMIGVLAASGIKYVAPVPAKFETI